MDFHELFSDLGSAGRGWRSPLAIVGIVLGAVGGGYLGYESEGVLGAAAGVGIGALIGWWLGIMLRGIFFFLLIFAVILAVTLGWDWLTGAGG